MLVHLLRTKFRPPGDGVGGPNSGEKVPVACLPVACFPFRPFACLSRPWPSLIVRTTYEWFACDGGGLGLVGWGGGEWLKGSSKRFVNGNASLFDILIFSDGELPSHQACPCHHTTCLPVSSKRLTCHVTGLCRSTGVGRGCTDGAGVARRGVARRGGSGGHHHEN